MKKEEKKVEKEKIQEKNNQILNDKNNKENIPLKDNVKNKEEKSPIKFDKNEDLNEAEEEEDEGDFNLENLPEEERIAFLQQREILLKLQEEAEARGEHFDIQEYLAQLAEQSEEDDENEQQNKSNKLNKSF